MAGRPPPQRATTSRYPGSAPTGFASEAMCGWAEHLQPRGRAVGRLLLPSRGVHLAARAC